MSGLNVTSKTAGDVAYAVKRQFGDESGVQIKDPDIIRWINDGQREIVSSNRVLKGRASVTSVAGQDNYTLPEVDMLAIESIHWNGVPLTAVPYPEVEKHILSNPTTPSGGVPSMWYEWGGTITFFPSPLAEGEIVVLYTKNPPHIDDLNQELSLPDKYFNTLVQYVLVQAYELDEDWDASNYKNQQFTDGLNERADDERTTADMTYPTVNVVMDY